MRIDVVDKLAEIGDIFTFDEALETTGIQRNVLWVILSRLEKRGFIERIEKGKYMIVPLGAEKGKYTLNEFVIGSILVDPYAISYWSALHHYGFTEQIPNVVFVQTTARKKRRKVDIFNVTYRIVRVKAGKFYGRRTEWVEDTKVYITDREKTIIDCLDKPQYCGGIVEVAKALYRYEEMDQKKLSEYAQRIGNTGVIRRLGFLFDRMGIDIDLPEIDTRSYLRLDPTLPDKGPKSSKWRLTINMDEKMLGDLE